VSGPRHIVTLSSPRRRGSSFVLLVALVLFPITAHAQTTWATYTNVRYAFAVDYPRDVFPTYTESDNSDGATFASNQPGVELRAFGFLNIDRQSPRVEVAARYQGKENNKTLAYTSIKRDSFIVSGTLLLSTGGEAIFYDRCNFVGDRVICFNLTYPAAQKTTWDKAVARMARSLRGGQNNH
jgi:hypothetical protein